MQDAKFYSIAPINPKSKIMVTRGIVDPAGTLLISEMECLDTGIIWRGTLTPGGFRGARSDTAEGFPKFYLIQRVQIEAVMPETVFGLEEIPDPRPV